jgi:pyridoxamine 5'-phosphate oxidase
VLSDPLELLRGFIADAAELPVPSAMMLATTDKNGQPHARTVLVTVVDDASVRFHSSWPTTKTRDLAANPRASGVFLWPSLGRQVIVTGTAAELSREVTAEAFPQRPRQLQQLAWAYEALLPAAVIEEGDVERAFAAAEHETQAPPSFTTIALTVEQLDVWEAGTPTTPPRKHRYTLGSAGWTVAPVLP